MRPAVKHLLALCAICGAFAMTAPAAADTTATLVEALRIRPPGDLVTSAAPAIMACPNLTLPQRLAVKAALVKMSTPAANGAEGIAAEWLEFIARGRWQDLLGLSDEDAEAAALTDAQRAYIGQCVVGVGVETVRERITEMECAIGQ